jgi:biofilm protein TabA
MIAGTIEHWRKHPGLVAHPVWAESFEWIEAKAASSDEGIFPLQSEGCYVRVMSYDLKSRQEANFESHRHTIDLQYTIEYAEGIEVHPVEMLKPCGDYLREKDFQFYETPEAEGSFIYNIKGRFCILFPEDGHQPQRAVTGAKSVRKLVVKIPVSSIRC